MREQTITQSKQMGQSRINRSHLLILTTGVVIMLMLNISLAAYASTGSSELQNGKPSSGFYAEMNVGSAKHRSNINPFLTHHNKVGSNLTLGYQFSPNISLEAGYTSNTIFDMFADNDSSESHLAVKGSMPLKNDFKAFGKFGLAHIRDKRNEGLATKINHAHQRPYYALGLDYSLTEHAYSNFQVSHVDGDNSTGNLNFISLGLGYIF